MSGKRGPGRSVTGTPFFPLPSAARSWTLHVGSAPRHPSATAQRTAVRLRLCWVVVRFHSAGPAVWRVSHGLAPRGREAPRGRGGGCRRPVLPRRTAGRSFWTASCLCLGFGLIGCRLLTPPHPESKSLGPTCAWPGPGCSSGRSEPRGGAGGPCTHQLLHSRGAIWGYPSRSRYLSPAGRTADIKELKRCNRLLDGGQNIPAMAKNQQ